MPTLLLVQPVIHALLARWWLGKDLIAYYGQTVDRHGLNILIGSSPESVFPLNGILRRHFISLSIFSSL